MPMYSGYPTNSRRQTHQVEPARERPLYRATQVIWYAFYAVETLLLFRFVLKLIAANTGAGFTQFIYGLSAPFVSPFFAIVPSPRVAGSALEWSTLIAMLVYWVIAWGIVRLLVMSKPVSATEAHRKLDKQDFEDGDYDDM